jgi:hypothetical protein
MDNLMIVNEEEKNIPTLAEAKLAYKVIFDRLSQNKDFSENDLETLTKIEKILKRNIEFKQRLFLKKITFKIFNFYYLK